MLIEMNIDNFALIDSQSINFSQGFNVFTGETGSGKSIVIDALLFVLGKRADKGYIRKNKNKLTIEALFHNNSKNRDVINSLLNESGIDLNDDILIFRREIFEDGKSICRLNDKIVTVNLIKNLSSLLISIHTQNESLDILYKDTQLFILDEYIHLRKSDIFKLYKETYSLLKSREEELNRITDSYDLISINRELDIINYQINEIEESKLNKNEIETIEDRIKIIESSEDMNNLIHNSYDELYSNSDNVLKKINNYKIKFDNYKHISLLFNDLSGSMEDVYYKLEDIVLTIRNSIDDFSYDETLLNELKGRYSQINKMFQKYGNDYDLVLNYYDELKKRREYLSTIDLNKNILIKEIELLSIKIDEYAKTITNKRIEGAKNLEKVLIGELKSLNMINSMFQIKFDNQNKFGINGKDVITFYVSFNKGEEVKSLNKIASGGEISRFMLALKKISSTFDKIETIVFDEIDSGISGAAANNVGDKLKEISKERQILCITHLPQIAAKADSHFLVKKVESENSTLTNIVKLNNDDRIIEIAKMISGQNDLTSSINYAKDLLKIN